jgi:hypothetical protein
MNWIKFLYLKNTARILFWIPGFFLLLSAGCKPEQQHRVSPAFYYWKTNFRMGNYEQQLMQQTGSKTLYIRLFDVDWDEQKAQPLPVGILTPSSVPDTSLCCIPVVFITQRCLYRLQEKDLPELAVRITKLMDALCTGLKITPAEIQIDCDWTRQSAALYFSLLKQLKTQAFVSNKKMSCTIRMHQVKYAANSGIPPVDRGLLMVYNMGNLKKYGRDNSILDVRDARDYMKNIQQYPLPLDVALPLYHWAILFEQKKFKGIVYNVSDQDFKTQDLIAIQDDLYRIRKNTSAGGYTFNAGTEIRFEHPGTKALLDIAGYISPRMNDTAFRVAFFHLDSMALRDFNASDISDMLQKFK